MAKSKVFTTNAAAGDVSFNVVPLVDCAFLMILFFILTSQLSSSGARINLPKPEQSQGVKAEESKLADKVIVSIVSAESADGTLSPDQPGAAKEYQINNQPIALMDNKLLVDTLKARRSEAIAQGVKDFFVVIRGDWRVRYSDVAPVMVAAGQAGIPKMNIVVLTD